MNNYVPSPTLEQVSGFGSHQTRELLKPIFPSLRHPDSEWKSGSNHPNQSADPGPIPGRSVFDTMKAVILFLFALSFVLPTAMAQTTVFEETFSTEQWISRPDGTSGIWHLEGSFGTGSSMTFGSTIAGDGTIGDSAYYAYYKNEFPLVSNRTYRISVRCSLATNSGTKEVVLGLGPDLAHARRSTAQVVLQTGALSTNGWSTFTATFNSTGNLSSWTQGVPVLWANVLGTPRTAMVYVDDIKIELLSNLPPESVNIETPGSWALVNSPAGIKVTAADPDNNIERIKFYSGTTYLGEDLSAPYLFSTTLPPGTHSVKAVAIDQFGLSKESASRTFVINSAPTVLSASPANGTVYSTGPVDLVASVADEDFNLVQVEFYVNGQKVGHTNTAPYSFRYNNTAGGQFTWYARAVDQLDSWGVSADQSFTIGALPTTSIISPQNHGTIGSCNVYIQAETTYGPGGIRTMNFFRNDSLIGTDSISPYEYKASGWEPGEYNIEARGVDLQGNDIEGAQIGIIVEAADLVLDLTETNKDCKYRIQGTLAPYQKLVISGLSMARRNDGSQFTGLGLVTGKEAKEWSEILIFEDFSPAGLGYTLTNAYGCSISGTFPLHPESNEPPSIESEPVLVSSLKLDPNTGEYYYCEPDAANLVIQPVVANTTGTVWYQALNPADERDVYQTFTNGTVQITSPMLEEQQLILNAITPLGCTGGHPLMINFSSRQSPVVTVAPVTVYGTEPALAVAQASGGTGTYSYTWSTGTCLDSSRCDSVMLANFANPVTVSVVDGNGCGLTESPVPLNYILSCKQTLPIYTHQWICTGETVELKSLPNNELESSIQWQKMSGFESWDNISGANQYSYITGETGIYRAMWTYQNNQTCFTDPDTIENSINFGPSEISVIFEKLDEASSMPKYVEFNGTNGPTVCELNMWLRTKYGLNQNFSLVKIQSTKDENGNYLDEFVQSINGIIVNNSQIKAKVVNDKIKYISCLIYRTVEVQNDQIITAGQALQSALNEVNASIYKWEVASEEANLKLGSFDPTASYAPKTNLVLVFDKEKNKLKPVYKFVIEAYVPYESYSVQVDAISNSIVGITSLGNNSNVPSKCHTAYSGYRSFTTDNLETQNSGNPMRCQLRKYPISGSFHAGITIFDRNVPFGTPNTIVNSVVQMNGGPDNYVWPQINGHMSPRFGATDIHYGIESMDKMLFERYNYRSYDGLGSAIRGEIYASFNTNNSTAYPPNLISIGRTTNNRMPMASLDAIGHEFGHLLSINKGGGSDNLAIGGNSLREGISDVFGKMLQFNELGHENCDWVVFGQCSIPVIRNLQDPWITGDPKFFKGINWTNGSLIHNDGVVLGHWFYLLSEGSSNSQNEMSLPFSVNPVGIIESGKLFFHTVTSNLHAETTWEDFYESTLHQSYQLNWTCQQRSSLISAWYAVGFGIPTIVKSGPTSFCDGGFVKLSTSIDNFIFSSQGSGSLMGYTFKWFKDGVQIPGATQMHFTASESGSYYVVASYCGANLKSQNVQIEVEQGSVSIAPAGEVVVCDGSNVTLTANSPEGYQYQWYKDGLAVQNAASSTLSVASPNSGFYKVKATKTNYTDIVIPFSPNVPILLAEEQPSIASVSTNGVFPIPGSSVNISLSVDISIEFPSKLEIYLVAPNDRVVCVFKDELKSGSDIISTFSDAGNLINSQVPPYLGKIKPITAFTFPGGTNQTSSTFQGLFDGPSNLNGEWTVYFLHHGAVDANTKINSCSLILSNTLVASVCNEKMSNEVSVSFGSQIFPTATTPASICYNSNLECGTHLVATPAGGIWSGPGVYKATTQEPCASMVAGEYYFNTNHDSPTGLEPGSYSLHYSYSGNYGCQGSIDIPVTIKPVPELDFFISNSPSCPEKPLSFQVLNPITELPLPTYTWQFPSSDSPIASYTGTTVNNISFQSGGTHNVILSVSGESVECSTSVTKPILVPERPKVSIGSKNYGGGDEIHICAEISSIDLLTVSLPGAQYHWWKQNPVTSLWEQVGGDANNVNVELNPISVGDFSETKIQVTIDNYYGCQALGEISVIRHSSVFGNNLPAVNYYRPGMSVVIPVNDEPITMCSGSSIILSPAGIQHVGSAPIQYRWTGPNISTFSTGELTINNLDEGTYEFKLQALTSDISQCRSEYRIITVEVNNLGRLSVIPVPYDQSTSHVNDFKLKVNYTANDAEFYELVNPDGTVAPGPTDANSSSTGTFEIYNPDNNSICKADGVYKLRIGFYDGCIAEEKFTLIGKKSFQSNTSDYTGNMILSGNVYMHHNVTFTSGRLAFADAHVFARGEVENVIENLPALPVSPGEVIGTILDVHSSFGINVELSIIRSTFESVLGRMWGGIRTSNIKSLNVEGFPASRNVIKDAAIGLLMGGGLQEFTNWVSHTTFQNCYLGLVSRNVYEANTPRSRVRMEYCRVTANPLEMKIPYHPRGNPHGMFTTKIGMTLEEGSNYPGPGNPLPSDFLFNNNKIENCLIGLKVNLDDPTNSVSLGNCEFKNNMIAGVISNKGLDRVQNCRFELPFEITPFYELVAGNINNIPPGSTAGLDVKHGFVLSNSDFTIAGFEQRHPNNVEKNGVHFTGQSDQKVSINGNRFVDMNNAIRLERALSQTNLVSVDFTLRCNEFQNTPQNSTNPITRKGLIIGEGVTFKYVENNLPIYNSIGGSQGFASGKQYPNANVWPVGPDVDRNVRPKIGSIEQDLHNPTSGWPNSQNWVAIEDQNEVIPFVYEGIKYWRYDNEFVGWGEQAVIGPINTAVPLSKQKVRTYKQTLLPPTNSNYVDPNDPTYDEACGTSFDLQPILFPARIAVVENPNTTVTSISSQVLPDLMLGDPVPNPSTNESKIVLLLPSSVQQALLQFVDLATGRVLQNIPVTERGKLEVILDVSKASSGIYGYRLMVDGKPIGTRKLAVVK